MKKIISLFAFFLFQGLLAQETAIGEINEVKQSGLQLVLLSPEIIAAANNNIDYLRITHTKTGAEMPFASYAIHETFKKSWIDFPLVSKIKNDSVSSYVISNAKQLKINELFIFIANSSVSKNVNVSGSNDGNEWFGLLQNYSLSNLSDSKSPQVEKNIVLPLNNYKFLKIDFDDKKSLPVEAKSFGMYQTKVNFVTRLELDNFNKTIQLDAPKKESLIYISFEKPHLISRIDFDIRSDLYFRNARILVNRERKIKNKSQKYQDEFFSFVLNSKTKNSFEFPEIFEKEIIIEIDNQDNPPLGIENIKLFQTPKYIIANLKQNETYEIKVSTAYEKPSYDIVNFLPKELDSLSIVTVENFNIIQNEAEIAEPKSFWQTQWFLWSAIILAGISIGYFALGLLKDVDKKG